MDQHDVAGNGAVVGLGGRSLSITKEAAYRGWRCWARRRGLCIARPVHSTLVQFAAQLAAALDIECW